MSRPAIDPMFAFHLGAALLEGTSGVPNRLVWCWLVLGLVLAGGR